jgi:hypothetical protein
MPNYCYNFFTVKDITLNQWRDLAATFEDSKWYEGRGFLETYYPEPDWRNIPNYKGDLPSAPDANGISRFPDGTEDSRWSDWRKEHWGSKCDVCSCFNDWDMTVPSNNFDAILSTAWFPLSNNCMAEISLRFPNCLLINCYHAEVLDLIGITTAKDGNVLGYTDSYSNVCESFMHQHSPDLYASITAESPNSEEDLEEYFWEHCDLGDLHAYIANYYESLAEKSTAYLIDLLAVASP